MPPPRRCPVCGGVMLAVDRSRQALDRENRYRESFVRQRLGHAPAGLESMDLTAFMHGGPGSLLRCVSCGATVRNEESKPEYEHDLYDSALMRHLYPRYLAAFREKQSIYRPLLGENAEVLELGSHTGAFLQTAEEWGWRPTGLDVGKSTSAFARGHGLSVRCAGVEDYSPHLRRPEALFIWNCFEQLEDPASVLRRSHQLLEHRGLLVLRVPNADFYRTERQLLESTHSARSLQLLGYNNLLGFPYLNGYTPRLLVRLLRANGFAPVSAHNSSLLTPPYPECVAAAARRMARRAPRWRKFAWRGRTMDRTGKQTPIRRGR